MTVSEKMREVISWSGVSQKELAQKTGIAQSTINGYLNGRTAPMDAIDKIADALGVNRWLLLNNEALPIVKEELTLDEIKLLEIYRSVPAEEEKMIATLAAYVNKMYRRYRSFPDWGKQADNEKPE